MKNVFLCPLSRAMSFAITLMAASAVSHAQTATPTKNAERQDIPVSLDRGNEQLSPDYIGASTLPPKVEKPLPNVLPSEADKVEPGDVVLTPEELINNPEQLEELLVIAIHKNEIGGLKLLLPLYAQVDTRDESLIEWGSAMIAMDEGRTEEAVSLYRKLISHFPDNPLLRFQTATALYRNNEMIAARSQFDKLRSAKISKPDLEVVERFIEKIDQRDQWSFNGSLMYVRDNNVNNVAQKGTRIRLPNGFDLIANRAQEKAQGINFSFDASKKWSLNDNLYASFNGSLSGVYYVDNKKYNDINTQISTGMGYRTARFDFEAAPFVQKRFYGRGSSGDGKLHAYSNTIGLRLNGDYWLSPNWKYRGGFEYSYDDHIKLYKHLNGNRFSFSNTLLFAPNQKQYWYAGLDVSYKDASNASDAYNRYSARLGWGQEWSKGISTRLSGSYAKRYAKGKDFFGFERKDDEYNASLSMWHRNLHLWGITPRLVFSYSKVKSNNLFYNYDTNKIYLDFSKAF